MRILFIAPYSRQDLTRAAAGLLLLARELGYEVAWLATSEAPLRPLRADIDAYVRPNTVANLTETLIWADTVVVVGCPLLTNLSMLPGLRVICICPWDVLSTEGLAECQRAHLVVAPCSAQARHLRAVLGIRSVRTCSWSVQAPVLRPEQIPTDGPRVLIPLHLSGVERCVVREVMTLACRLAVRCPTARVTVLTDRSRLPVFPTRKITKATRCAALRDRLTTLVHCNRQAAQRAAMADADLVVWPSHLESFGLVGLEARAAGCAVVGYDVPPIRGVIDDGCGVLVPGEISYDTYRTPVARGNYLGLEQAALQLLEDPHRLQQLKEGAAANLETRDRKFRAFWVQHLAG